jgi:cytochrome b pre-mRNA-processing protein 3
MLIFYGEKKSMFGLFKKKKPYEQESFDLFLIAQDAARNAYFYEELAVPDTTEGRFDLLLVHLFLVIERVRGEEGGAALSQALFDSVFFNIDEGYREIGVGDMGVPKRIKKLMLAFNGRMHAYEKAIAEGRAALEDVLDRNLYHEVYFNDGVTHALTAMSGYMIENTQHLQSQPIADIMSGQINFIPPETIAKEA